MKLKSFGFVLSLLNDHIQVNTVEKDFQILKNQNTTDMTHGNLSYHRMFLNRKKGKYDMISEILVSKKFFLW